MVKKLKAGDVVLCNGREGAIREICTGQLAGMAVVRLSRGLVCVSGQVCVSLSELRPVVAPAKP